MALVMWDESFSVGNAMLDSDHRILLTLLNQLHDAIDTGQSHDVVGNVVSVLTEYVEHHFRREEALLTRSGFPHRDGHIVLHRALETQLRIIRDRWNAGDHKAVGDEVLDFLKKWLTDHILVSDKAYRPWIEYSDGGIAGEGADTQ